MVSATVVEMHKRVWSSSKKLIGLVYPNQSLYSLNGHRFTWTCLGNNKFKCFNEEE